MATASVRPAAADVLQIIDSLDVGDAQTRLITLARCLTPDTPLNVLSLRAGNVPVKAALRDAGAQVAELSGMRIWWPGSYLKMARFLRENPCASVHVHLTYATILAAPVARALGKRVLVSLHSADNAPATGPRSLVLNWLERLALRHVCDTVLFVGDRVAVANRHRIGRTKAVTMPNVVALIPPITASERSDRRLSLGIADSDIAIIATGRLSEQKDHVTLLAAFASVIESVPDALLLIVGRGELDTKLKEICGTLGLNDRVRFLGERQDVRELLALADIFALSSAWDGLPVGLLEAMATGLPVAATDVGDIATVVSDAAGVIVPPGRPDALAGALVMLASDPELRRSLGAGAIKAVRPFTDVTGWFQTLEQTYRTGSDVCHGKGSIE